MGLINKDERQSVFDFILEKTGAISGLFEFLNKNNLTNVDVPAGEYVVNDVVKEEVVNFFASISPEVSIATGAVTILDGTIIAQAKNSNGDVVATKTISLIDNVIEIPDSEVSVNGSSVGTLSSTAVLNVVLKDQNNDVVVPNSSSMTATELLLQVNVGSSGITSSSAMPLATGQTTSYYDNDDGHSRRGRPFFTLPIIDGIQQMNHFGTKWRFTGADGGYYDRDSNKYCKKDGTLSGVNGAFPYGLRCDWSTLDSNSDLILWCFDVPSFLGTWKECLMYCESLTVGMFSTFDMPNISELMLLYNQNTYPIFGSPEFSGLPNSGWSYFFCSTSRMDLPEDVCYALGADSNFQAWDKADERTTIPLKIINISDLI